MTDAKIAAFVLLALGWFAAGALKAFLSYPRHRYHRVKLPRCRLE